MKVLVLTTRVPFVHGGAEELRDHLVLNLERAGVQAEAVSLPFTWEPADRLIEEMLIARSIELTNVDRVIALKFPAYLVRHPNSVIWLVHQYRQAYDLWDAGQSNIPPDARGDSLRAIIKTADEVAFDNARAVYAFSPVTQARVRRYHGREIPVLPGPLNDPELFEGAAADGYVFAGGRVGQAKRQALLVRALAHAPGVTLVIAGPPDTRDDLANLQRLAADLGVEDRLVLDVRFLPRLEYARLVNQASAVVYIPFDEDSPGYVTMEACQAAKPVVTTHDAGGVLEVVHHDETGLVVNPTPEALGEAMVRVLSDAQAARRMGAAGRDLLASRGFTWPATIERLLS